MIKVLAKEDPSRLTNPRAADTVITDPFDVPRELESPEEDSHISRTSPGLSSNPQKRNDEPKQVMTQGAQPAPVKQGHPGYQVLETAIATQTAKTWPDTTAATRYP